MPPYTFTHLIITDRARAHRFIHSRMESTHIQNASACSPPLHGSDPHHSRSKFWALMIGCVGVVYGDIGTSPLYALRESLHAVGKDGVAENEVLGVLSLIIWSLILVVTIKYVFLIMRADNKGEGGTLSLMALAQSVAGRYSALIFTLGMVGASLFYGDAILTPAISVLSAVEGLKLVTPAVEPYIIPLTLVIIVTLFAVQSRGTARMASFFGPITVLWFLAMAACAIPYLIATPHIFLAFFPIYGVYFLMEYHALGLLVLGGVFLAVTGAEALYADMGHFGRPPIRAAWISLVFPCLTLNYLGQGALILSNPAALENPFFLMAPSWALLPMVILATFATVIASQAVITGAYSITQQAIQLGLLPRLEIRHTSESLAGQVYMPQVNILLLVGVMILVLEFKSSGALASAYGIAVSGTMLTTTLLAFTIIWKFWRKPLWVAILTVIPFLIMDVTFVSANLMKVLEGGYVPLLMGAVIVLIMWIWKKGSLILMQKSHKASIPMLDLIEILAKSHPARVPGTAVFLTSDPEVAPAALMHNLKHNKVLHEFNIIMTIRTSPSPRVNESQRMTIETLADSVYRVTLLFGYMETPNVPKALSQCRRQGIKFDIMSTSFFLSRRSIKPSASSGLRLWQDHIYILMARNASNATEFYHIPAGRVVELGTQLTI